MLRHNKLLSLSLVLLGFIVGIFLSGTSVHADNGSSDDSSSYSSTPLNGNDDSSDIKILHDDGTESDPLAVPNSGQPSTTYQLQLSPGNTETCQTEGNGDVMCQ